MSTKWESYSQTLLKVMVPEWRRVIVDGRTNWSPTGFIQSIIDRDSDYIVHVDEDCFVQSREALQKLIGIIDQDDSYVAAGMPDGGCYYRNHNPAALNLFFVVFRTVALRKAWSEKVRWNEIQFRENFANEVTRQCPDLDQSRIHWDEAEPYYPLFWSLLEGGGRFLYLRENLLRSRWSSEVLLPSGELIAEHMWYLRQWFSNEVMPGHDCPNSTRYANFAADFHLRFRHYGELRLILAGMHLKRLIRRSFV